jgi:short-subunit dehydrogenase involved in D-alanine esterification of teichoic acids
MKTSENTVLITGGASGIGLAFAKELVARKNQVIICGRTLAKLELAKEENPELHIIECDISKASDLQAMTAQVEQTFPGLNILVNNAGIYNEFDFVHDEKTLEIIEQEIAINLTAPLKLTSMLLPQLMKHTQAAVINVSSGFAYTPNKTGIVYGATKAGLRSFSKSLRYQLADSSVKVFEVLPPLVDTPAVIHNSNKKMSSQEVVANALKAVEKDIYEIPVGQSKLLKLMTRLAPGVIEKKLSKI